LSLADVRWAAISTVLVAVAAFALLFAPAPPDGSDCVYTYRLSGSMRMVMSCDSDEFIVVAQHPERLLEKDSYRQSRPLVPAAAALMTRVEPSFVRRRITEDTPPHEPGWLSYVALNLVVLVGALAIFRRLIAPPSTLGTAAVGILTAFLLFNDVVKGFFWSAHTQMWNVLMPLIAISLSRTQLDRPERSWRFIVTTGLLLGLGALAYASMLVCAISAAISIPVGFWINRQRPAPAPLMLQSGLLLGAFAVPTLIWIAIVTSTAGGFSISEAKEFHEFIWILERFREGGTPALLAQSAVFAAEFGTRLWEALWPVLVLLMMVLIPALASPSHLAAVLRGRSRLLLACAITSILCLGFFGAIGFYRTRLAFNVVIPLVVGASAIITSMLERQSRGLAFTTVLLAGSTAAGYIASALLRITWPY
jgi:hypothetical protein